MRLTITEEENKPSIQKIDFICDGGIHPKLDKYDYTKTLFQKHSFTYIVGRPQSGKSNLLQNFFKKRDMLRKCYHNVFYVCPSSSSLKDDIFNKLSDEKRFADLTQESLGSILNVCEASTKEEKNMIVIDDCAASLKDNDLRNMFLRLILNRRHIGGGVSVIIVSQSYNLLPLQLRKMLNTLILFKPTYEELNLINEEIFYQDRKYIKKMMEFFFDQRYNFLTYNLDSGKYYKNFDGVTIEEE